MKMPKFSRKTVLLAGLTAAAILVFALRDEIRWAAYTVELPLPVTTEQGLLTTELQTDDVTTVASGLEIPWEIAFLPDGDMLVTERPGRLKRISKDGAVREIVVEPVKHVGEGGLLGLALHPKFAESGLLYLYRTVETPTGFRNRVDRYRLEADTLVERTTILQNIPGAVYHDGGELAFGPDGLLYVTTGDAGNGSLAQDLGSLAGKILRVKDDGAIPADNPFKTAVWSYGHRNPQGLAWDAEGRLWATEHGRSGVQSGFDELNRIEKGRNYGWPVIQGDEQDGDLVRPVANSGAWDTWAPAGMARVGQDLFFGGLRGEALYQARIAFDGSVTIKSHFEKEYGRLRAVVYGPDNMLYVTTSNTDGRGLEREGDDRILKINPRRFE